MTTPPESVPPEFSFEALRRDDDTLLLAYDATDRLLLDEAAGALADSPAGTVSVIGDRYGALTLGAVAWHGATAVRTHQDALTGERTLARNAGRFGLSGAFTSHPLSEVVTPSTRVVLLQLPRSLDELDEIAEVVAGADPAVRLFAGGRVKHMTLTMNDTLGRWFESVGASLGRQKSRVLTASGPRPQAQRPRRERPASAIDPDLSLTVCAHGGVFAGTGVDIGTRFLLGFEDRMRPAADALDLGCGTGVVAAALALARPELRVTATDVSAAAVASARATAAANGVADRVTVVRDVGTGSLAVGSQDLVVLNPPFHTGAAVEPGLARHLFADAARVLRPGGELWTVWNSHLHYRDDLERIVGPTRQAGRNPKFTVTVSTAR